MVLSDNGLTIQRVVANFDGSPSNTAVLGSMGGYTNIYTLDQFDGASQSRIVSWAKSHGCYIDQTTSAPAPAPTPTPAPVETLDPTLNTVINISPPSGADFAATRQYLLQYRNWQAVRVNNSAAIVYIWDGGLVDSQGKFYTGFAGNSSPGRARPTGGVASDIPLSYRSPSPLRSLLQRLYQRLYPRLYQRLPQFLARWLP